KRNVYRHLVAVEVGVECRTDQRMDLDGLALDQHWLKRLNAEPVQCRSTIQEHRMLANHLFKNVPNDRRLAFNHLAWFLDGSRVALFLELVVNERFEQLERHLLRQTTLMKFQFGADNDN